MIFEQLQITPAKTGNTITRGFSLLSADYGDGYSDWGLIGHPQGLRTWVLLFPTVDQVAPTTRIFDGMPIVGSDGITPITRADYLWDFHQRMMAAGNSPFLVIDPYDRLLYLAQFIDTAMTFEKLTRQVFAASTSSGGAVASGGSGLNLQQTRIRGYDDHGVAIGAVSAPNPVVI